MMGTRWSLIADAFTQIVKRMIISKPVQSSKKLKIVGESLMLLPIILTG